MKVSNWDKWQTFRKDRGTPPWIKVYRNLLSNEEWVELSDSEKGQLVSIWLLAADKNGEIPSSPKMVQRMAMLDKLPNISKFKELGFLNDDDNHMVTTCQPHDNHELNLCPQVDAPEESRVEERRVKIPYQLIVDAYHSCLPEMTRVMIISEKRKTSIKKVWNYHIDHQDIEWWEYYFGLVRKSNFLMGRLENTNSNHSTWNCDFEFLINVNNFIKVLEGKYK